MKAVQGFLLTVLLVRGQTGVTAPPNEADIRLLLRAGGTITLPPGTIELTRPLELTEGAVGLTLRGSPTGTTLRAAPSFRGPALLIAKRAQNLRIENITFDGRRAQLEKPRPTLPDDTAFSDFFPASGLWVTHAQGTQLNNLTFREIASFAVLITRGQDIHLEAIRITDSGSRNAKGRNNTTGGILFEEGVTNFTVRRSTFKRILGNAIWTHSWHHSPRSQDGVIANNTFAEIARDAIQIGHATNIVVEQNQISRIGFPIPAVDLEGQGIPVGIDTAGDVDHTFYRNNQMSEINGKCFDLDGFHDSEVSGNTCINRRPATAYPTGHFGVVFNNTNPGMKSANVVIRDNDISGMRFGGIFVIGTGHRLLNNRLRNLNTAHCNDNKNIQCVYVAAEPDMLRSGIYLGLRAERPAPASKIEIRGNIMSGYGVQQHCIVLAPGLRRADNVIMENICGATP